MEESNNWIIALVAGAALASGVFYFLRKNGTEKEKELIQAEESLDILSLDYVKDYFKNNYTTVIKENPKAVPIVLKVDKNITALIEDTSYQFYNKFAFSKDTSYQFFVIFTFYNEETKQILEQNTKYIKAKKMDTNLTDAFGDQDMLILK